MSIEVSVVIPLYEEEESVMPLCQSIRDVMEGDDLSYEILLVDDGSRDGTFDEARRAAGQAANVRVIKLTRNFGQTAALKAGFEHARGRIIVTMDGDLQNDPADIPMMIRKITEGYDMVVGWRRDRKDKLLTRKIPSRAANWMLRQVAGTAIKDNGCAIRAYRHEVVRDFPLYSEMHRLLPTMLAMTGARIAEVPVAHHERKFGRSKYGLARTYKVLLDMIAVRSILTYHRSALFGFGWPATICGFAGLVIMILGITVQLSRLDVVSLVLPGTGVLLMVLSASYLTFGVLSEMIYTFGDVRLPRRPDDA